MCANASGWRLTTSAVSIAYTFPDGPTACASDAVRRPATISATLSPFLSPMNSTTSDAFQAGLTVGAADCESALVAAPIEMASVTDNPSFRMCQSFSWFHCKQCIAFHVASPFYIDRQDLSHARFGGQPIQGCISGIHLAFASFTVSAHPS